VLFRSSRKITIPEANIRVHPVYDAKPQLMSTQPQLSTIVE